MLSPTRFDTNVSQRTVHKTLRWALWLAEFNYTVEHIQGRSNHWADMLTRWASPQNLLFLARQVSDFRVLVIAEERPELRSVQANAEVQVRQAPSSDSQLSMASENGINV